MGWNYIASPTKDASNYGLSAKLILPTHRGFGTLETQKAFISKANALCKKTPFNEHYPKFSNRRLYTLFSLHLLRYHLSHRFAAIELPLSAF